MTRFEPGDRVQVKSSWNGKNFGKGTVEDTGENGCRVALDKEQDSVPAHFYNSELRKIKGS